MVSVGTFIERWEKLEKSVGQGGPKDGGKAAKKKLAERGLKEAVIKEARELITKLGGVAGPLPSLPDIEQEENDLAKAEAALWAWYLEWSKIARTTITQRALLRQLGFLKGARGVAGNEDESADDAVAEEVDAPDEEEKLAAKDAAQLTPTEDAKKAKRPS